MESVVLRQSFLFNFPYNQSMANTQTLYKLSLRPKTENDASWLRQHLINEWGGEPILAYKQAYYPTHLPGFVAILEGAQSSHIVGEVTYVIEKPCCEIITLSSLREGIGIGTALFSYVEAVARAEGCRKLRLVTPTDDLRAIGFYQKRGMRIVEVLPDALEAVRRLKPKIPRTGRNGILLQDELLFEKLLT
jgi:ribosomal protein S18 acetylase RimI-like enzyme